MGKKVGVRLPQRVIEIFPDHKRVISHTRSSQHGFYITVNAHMPKANQRYAERTPASSAGVDMVLHVSMPSGPGKLGSFNPTPPSTINASS